MSPEDRMRAFLAVELPETVRLELSEVARSLARGVRELRAAAADNVHLTLRFLGDVPVAEAEALLGPVGEAVAVFAPFTVEMRGLGVFPNLRRPRVLWAGVAEPALLVDLALAVARSTRQVVGADDRPFRAHVTIGRFRGPAVDPSFAGSLAALSSHRFGTVAVAEVVLFESRLGGPTPRYRPVWRASLARR